MQDSNMPKHEYGARISMSSRNSTTTRTAHRGSPRNASRLREYEGFFPRHPARGHSDTSMSVIVPDMPSPLSSAPSALALKHDRRRDYFTDSSTFAAATGRAAGENASIRYDIREHSSVEPTDTPLRSTVQTRSPTILQIDTGGSALPKTSHSSGRGSSNGSMPLFRRTGSDQTAGAARHGNYGPNSRLPRFMIDKINSGELNGRGASGSIDGAAADGSRASVSSSISSAINSPRSASSSSAMQTMLELEEAKLLSAERKGQLQAVDSILSEEQKIAYVGLVYVLLVDIQDRLNVQFKESQSSTASYMNFSRRLMRQMYSHIHLSPEEQRMVELLPRHKITAADMATSLAAQGDTILVEADQDLAVVHSQAEEELVQALRHSSECRSSSESQQQSKSPWNILRRERKNKDIEEDPYSQYAMLPSDTNDPDSEPEHDLPDSQQPDTNEVASDNTKPDLCQTSPASTYNSRNSRSSSSSSSSNLDNVADASQHTSEGSPRYPGHSLATPSLDPQSNPPESEIEKASDDITLTKVGADQPLAIDVRATLILDLFLLLLNDEVYDSRGRYLLRRLAEALNYPWVQVMRCERRVTQQLNLYEYAVDVTTATKGTTEVAVKERAKEGRTRRMVIIGLATVGGGLVIGLSAGLLAPAIGAGIGATLGAIGVANTGAFFGSVGGTALITGAATLTGSGLAGRQITRRTRFAEQFEFIPCINERQTNLILTVPGWLGKADNGVFTFSTLDPLNGDHCSLLWESEALGRLGSSLRMIVGEVFSITLTQTLQHTVLPSLLGPLSVPMWLAKLGYVLDNPWSNGCELATKAGPVVADLLLQRVQGQRPVTLIGYSIGARLIFYMLLELAKMNAYGLIEDVYLFGAPVVESEEEWRKAASVVGGRFVNAYSTKDWILGFFYRTTNLGRRSIAGMHPVSGVNGLENYDVSSEVPGHNAYREIIPLLLHNMGVRVTDVVLHDPNEKPGESEDDRAMINELEKAAEMLEEHEKKKKNIWPRRWSFWDTGSSSSEPPAAPTTGTQGTLDQTLSPGQIASAQGTSTVQEEVDAAARELAELGIHVKEVPSTLPALVVVSDHVSPDKASSANDVRSTQKQTGG
ncbi:hypothetical protein GGI15_001670 [Coemansia interrupta]|uniref:DUF726-domain-containing protein n=1 Tax=Coemansia interrupta TaxID=1126814 RepID=A0A9W8HJJ6_9FUNG|nr:hypothetical protein GGI15_001670 [Coemansia interrupta]